MTSLTGRDRALVVLAALVHVLVTGFVWRDINSRPVTGLRGGRALWRVLTALNTGNSVVHLTIGRRRHPHPGGGVGGAGQPSRR